MPSQVYNTQRYSNVAIALHWIIAVLLIYMLFWGEGLIKTRGTATAANPGLHATIGLTILILGVARLVWRLINPPPPDVPMPAWQKMGSHAVHWLFYALIILLPLTGMAALDHSISGKHPEYAQLSYFNLFPIPHYPQSLLGQSHDILSKVGIALLAIHVLAALKHQFIDKDNLIGRMIFGSTLRAD